VLWPCAETTTGTFSRPLKEAGVEVTALLLYRTIARKPNAIRKDLKAVTSWDVIVFAAPSQVRAYVDTEPPPWKATAVGIGETTGRAMRRYGIDRPVIAPEPSEDGLYHAIMNVLQTTTPEIKD
jgi:uroporphyrinogen-III synthase